LSSDDAAVTGTFILFTVSLYQLISVRRENQEIGLLLRDTRDESTSLK